MFNTQNLSDKTKKKLFYFKIVFFFFFAGVFYLISLMGDENLPPKSLALFHAVHISFFLSFWEDILEKLKGRELLRFSMWILTSGLYILISFLLIDKELTPMRMFAYSGILLVNAIFFYRPEITGFFMRKKIR